VIGGIVEIIILRSIYKAEAEILQLFTFGVVLVVKKKKLSMGK